jgi:LPXTG-site transpeptidase (sortase) family protein
MKQPKTVDVTSVSDRLAGHGPTAKLGFRKGVLPPLLGILIMLGVMAALNGELLMAQFKYHFSKPVAAASQSPTMPKPAVEDTKSPYPELGPRLTIPALNVDAPINFDNGTAEWQIQIALRSGVVHYDTSSMPGKTGNVVIFGHSSGQPWAPGDYKFVFTLLDKLKVGDKIYLDYLGTRYTYEMKSSVVVTPSDVGVLKSGNDHELTLITCTPVGTSKNRLVVHAEQISPTVKSDGQTSDGDAGSPSLTSLPGSAH